MNNLFSYILVILSISSYAQNCNELLNTTTYNSGYRSVCSEDAFGGVILDDKEYQIIVYSKINSINFDIYSSQTTFTQSSIDPLIWYSTPISETTQSDFTIEDYDSGKSCYYSNIVNQCSCPLDPFSYKNSSICKDETGQITFDLKHLGIQGAEINLKSGLNMTLTNFDLNPIQTIQLEPGTYNYQFTDDWNWCTLDSSFTILETIPLSIDNIDGFQNDTLFNCSNDLQTILITPNEANSVENYHLILNDLDTLLTNTTGSFDLSSLQNELADKSELTISSIGKCGNTINDSVIYRIEDSVIISLSPSADTTLLKDENLLIQITSPLEPNHNLKWYKDNFATSLISSDYLVTNNGCYFVTSSSKMCTSSSDTICVDFQDLQVNIESTTSQQVIGQSFTLTADVSNSTGSLDYEWHDSSESQKKSGENSYPNSSSITITPTSIKDYYVIVTDRNSNVSKTSEWAFSNTTVGFMKPINTSNNYIYPTVSNGLFYTNLKEIKKVNLYNLNGELINSIEGDSIDFSDVQNGTYIIRLITDNNTYSSKVQIQK